MGNPLMFIDPTGMSSETPLGWSQDNIYLANRFGVFGNGGETFDDFAGIKSWDLGDDGLVILDEYGLNNKGKMLSSGKDGRYVKPSSLPIALRYFPRDNSNAFNFVQTVHSNFTNDQMHEVINIRSKKSSEVILRDNSVVDGFNDQGTYYTTSELGSRLEYGEGGAPYYTFSDRPGRVFVEGETVKWSAELSIVNSTEVGNRPIITFTYGFNLKGNRRKSLPFVRTYNQSNIHNQHILDAIIE